MTKQLFEGKSKEQKDNEEYSKNFARIPNMLFTSFKYLSKEEKYLYCTLKCVYWDAKPRFVSLRELGDVTGYSRGALANMLPRLHKCGLIHAEIRRERNSKGIEYGNPKYNITILDIWELNKQYYSCPLNGRDVLDPSLVLVHEKGQDSLPNGQACPSDVPNPSTKRAEAGLSNGQVHAQVELAKDKDLLKTSSKKEERETPAPASSTPEPSFSLSSSQSLLKSLTDEQADFWRRWCALTGCGDDALTEKSLPDVAWLAERITTTVDLDSLYQSTSEMLLEFTKARGQPFTPPHLKNLVKHHPTWKGAQDAKQKQREQASQKAPSGTGAVKNWTAERLAGNAPPLVYSLPPERKRPGRTAECMGTSRELASLQESIGRRVVHKLSTNEKGR